MRWRVLVPLKRGPAAKTRLRGATAGPEEHERLVRAIQLDTLDALLAATEEPLLAGVFVVTDRLTAPLPTGVEVLADPGGGLNAALASSAAELSRRYPDDAIVAIVGDLPALRPQELIEVLRAAPATGRSFVRDAEGTGTTLLAAGIGQRLQPAFGIDSARRHLLSGALELDAGLSVRADVDGAEDLHRCLLLGAGALTSRLLVQLG